MQNQHANKSLMSTISPNLGAQRVIPMFIALLMTLVSVPAQDSGGDASNAAPSRKPVTEKPAPKTSPETTPTSLPGAEAHIYRSGSPEPMRLFVFKPKDWKAEDRRPAVIFFFGGGWSKGTPEKSAGWAKHFAKLGLVGIAPDYRTRNRFDTTPLEAVADGRAALHWVQDHAAELGVDSAKIIVGGNSAGGHVALWTAITKTPPGSDVHEAPGKKPAALILLSTVSDTSMLFGYTPYRFGTNAAALSPIHQLEPQMPPMLMFHGDADKTVPYRQAVALRERLVASSNVCELITVPGGDHGFTSQLPEWKDKTFDRIRLFLTSQGLLVEPQLRSLKQ
jgi:acetyl esterase